MRIITGKAKGTKLYTLEGEDVTRPTSERAKEAIFSMVQFEIEGRRVLDLFAGSGQLGLEAMSRGACYAMFVDQSRDAISIVKKNAEKTHFFRECGFIVSDYRSYLRKIGGVESFDMIFLDPPYNSDYLCDALCRIYDGGIIKDTGTVVCESDRPDVINTSEEVRARYTVERSAGYGRVCIFILRPIDKSI